MNQVRNHRVADPPAVREDVKIVCAWCHTVTQEGSGDDVSHGICEQCEKIMEDDIERENRERDEFVPYHDGKCRGPFDFVEGQVLMGFAIFMICFLVVIHWLIGSKVPELIDWQSKNQPVQGKAHRSERTQPSSSTYSDSPTEEVIF